MAKAGNASMVSETQQAGWRLRVMVDKALVGQDRPERGPNDLVGIGRLATCNFFEVSWQTGWLANVQCVDCRTPWATNKEVGEPLIWGKAAWMLHGKTRRLDGICTGARNRNRASVQIWAKFGSTMLLAPSHVRQRCKIAGWPCLSYLRGVVLLLSSFRELFSRLHRLIQ